MYLQSSNRLTDIENKFMVTTGVVKDTLGAWDEQIHTTIYKADK